MKTERALIGIDCQLIPRVLATDGTDVMAYVEDNSTNAEEIGMTIGKRPPGLYLWEGALTTYYYGLEQTEQTYFKGSVRPVEPHEIAVLYAMKPPE